MITIIIAILVSCLLLGGAVFAGLIATVGSIFAAPFAFDVLMFLALIKYIRRRRWQREHMLNEK